MKEYKIIEGNCIEGMKQIPDGTVQTCITSPPYWGLRSYAENRICLRSDLSENKKEEILLELKSLGINPIGD
jgi:DNA modification methylase